MQLRPEELKEFEIGGDVEEFQEALGKEGLQSGKLVSVKKKSNRHEDNGEVPSLAKGENKKKFKRKIARASGKQKRNRV